MTIGANLEDVKPEVSNMSLDLSSRTRNFRCFDELFCVVNLPKTAMYGRSG